MEPREFIEIRTRRYMAQALEEFEKQIEDPLRAILVTEPSRGDVAAVLERVDGVKRTFRKKLQTLDSDCADLMPSDVQINALELVRR
jgi:hypothetical protein